MNWLLLLMVLVCDLIIGYELGCYITTRRVRSYIHDMINSLNTRMKMIQKDVITNESDKGSKDC